MKCRIINNGSTKNGTIHEVRMLASFNNSIYLCSAFETQMHNIEY